MTSVSNSYVARHGLAWPAWPGGIGLAAQPAMPGSVMAKLAGSYLAVCGSLAIHNGSCVTSWKCVCENINV